MRARERRASKRHSTAKLDMELRRQQGDSGRRRASPLILVQKSLASMSPEIKVLLSNVNPATKTAKIREILNPIGVTNMLPNKFQIPLKLADLESIELAYVPKWARFSVHEALFESPFTHAPPHESFASNAATR